MKTLLALGLLGLSISFCSLPNFNKSNNDNNSNNSNNSNSESSPKDKFIGTWEHPADDRVDLLTLVINRDDTWNMKRTFSGNREPKRISGKYTVKDDRIFFDGEIGKDAKDGFKLSGNTLTAVVDDGKLTIVFKKK